MSLSFDGSGHQYVSLSAGTLGAAGTGAYTIVTLHQPTNIYTGPISLWSGSVTGTEERSIFGDGGPWFGENDFTAGFDSIVDNTWYLIGQSKPAGSNPYRWHLWSYASDGSGAKTHANTTSTTFGDGSAIAGIRLGDTAARWTYGQIALVAVWKRALSDADFNALCGNTAQAFMNLSTGAPDALWLCNVASPSSIVDSTGNGASYVTTSGAGMSAGSDPPSFDYSLSGGGNGGGIAAWFAA